MKRIVSLIAAIGVFALCFCSCSSNENNNSSISEIQSEVNSNAVSDIQSDVPDTSTPSSNPSLKPQTNSQSNSQANNQPNPDISSNPQNSSNISSEKPPLVDMANLSSAVLEKFTDEQLEWVHKNAEKFPENFVSESLNKCGRIIKSALSREEAVENAKKKFTTPVYDVTKCELISETDNFYIIYVKWVPKGEPDSYKFREENAVCFKKSIFQVDNDTSEGVIPTQNKSTIKNIFDYCYYYQYSKLGGYKVLYSELTEKIDDLTYTVYFVGTVYGDSNVKDDVFLYKQQIVIEKYDREFERQDKVTLKKIGVIGEGYYGGDGFTGE